MAGIHLRNRYNFIFYSLSAMGDDVGDCERGGLLPVDPPLFRGVDFGAIAVELWIAIEIVVIVSRKSST
jgi:hypothetical protein